MRRRDFLKNASALLAMPAMPVKALAGMGSTGAVKTAAIIPNKTSVDLAYSWCKMYAQNRSSFEFPMLSKQLGFSEEVTKQVFQRMLKNKVIKKTAVRGIYQSTKPYVDMSQIYNSQPDPLAELLEKKKREKERFENRLEMSVFTPIPKELWLA